MRLSFLAVTTIALTTSPVASFAPIFSKHTPVVTSLDASKCGQYDFDVAIIGCGVGGHGAALHSRAQDLSTAVFAGNDVGGTCVNRGCVPSKALLAASGRVREMQNEAHLASMGIKVQAVEYDREGIAAHAKNLANKVKSNLEGSLVGLGVEVIQGRGILTNTPHEIKDGNTGKVYTAKVRTSIISSRCHHSPILDHNSTKLSHNFNCSIFFSGYHFGSGQCSICTTGNYGG